jgi:hypothetical protein
MKKLGKYIAGAVAGTTLLAETIFGSGCAMNMAIKGFAISVGTDASDAIVDTNTGKAETKYPGSKTNIVPVVPYYRNGCSIYNRPNIWYSQIPFSNELKSSTWNTSNGVIYRIRNAP